MLFKNMWSNSLATGLTACFGMKSLTALRDFIFGGSGNNMLNGRSKRTYGTG